MIKFGNSVKILQTYRHAFGVVLFVGHGVECPLMGFPGQVFGLEDLRGQAPWPWPWPRRLGSLALASSLALTVDLAFAQLLSFMVIWYRKNGAVSAFILNVYFSNFEL